MAEEVTRADGSPAAPARGYSWPPFEPGHELSVQHGAYSPRKVDPLAQELVALVLADPQCGHLGASLWRPALWAWARAEAQAQLLSEFLDRRARSAKNGVGDLGDERVRSAYLLLHRAEARATTQRGRLGLDPLSAARLGRDRAATQVDVARVMAELERRDRGRDAGQPGDIEGEVEP